MLWIHNPGYGTFRSAPAPGFPRGKYLVRPTLAGAELVVNSVPPEPLMLGTAAECKALAEGMEADVVVEYPFEPDLSDLAGLPPKVAALVAAARRLGLSAERLKSLVERKVPPELVKLEVGIYRECARKLPNLEAGK